MNLTYLFNINSTVVLMSDLMLINPIALRKAKIVYSFGLSECNNRVKKQIVKVLLKSYFA